MIKEMEAKTENRYEYRKPQEKRKQMIAPDLFEFAYVPDWYGHLAELESLALPESWKFRKPFLSGWMICKHRQLERKER